MKPAQDSLSAVPEFEPINRGYDSVFRPGKLSVGLVVPLESYTAGPIPTMTNHVERVQLAERLGFSAVWLRDVPFNVPSFGDAGQPFDPLEAFCSTCHSLSGLVIPSRAMLMGDSRGSAVRLPSVDAVQPACVPAVGRERNKRALPSGTFASAGSTKIATFERSCVEISFDGKDTCFLTDHRCCPKCRHSHYWTRILTP